ncbi:hypothetical protein BCR36DRAFT_584960 [Piromyces finnis]|uniref:Uncharacterized protein n=1 Tax=Piromyces finnis TaxID=1754191 RepID=A0A1Y1V5E8_9FUNG|nr:hypothetical protein BCR36DRAFT_584960 [Piromyces finnis]|eukprot:ORX46844.1 hypothetical protein BCR36DRAFT_584960 [Piromyces finnis]
MKLVTKFLTLVSATTVLCDFLDGFSNVINNVNFSAITECKNALSKYSECQIDSINLESVSANIDDFCMTFNTENCQTFYKQGITRIPECQDISPELFAPGQIVTDMLYSLLKLGCSKDENNNYCPLAGRNIFTANGINEEEFMRLLNESCKSKQCYDSISDTFTRVENAELLMKLLFKNQMNELSMSTTPNESIGKINNFLQSNNCTSQHTENLSDGTANTSSKKLKSILFIGLSILLATIL